MVCTKNNTATNNHGTNRGPRKMNGIIDMCDIIGNLWKRAGSARRAEAGRIGIVIDRVGIREG